MGEARELPEVSVVFSSGLAAVADSLSPSLEATQSVQQSSLSLSQPAEKSDTVQQGQEQEQEQTHEQGWDSYQRGVVACEEGDSSRATQHIR